ncbi:MAG: pyruvate:ferredoxin (flavodoxin) oxidoreductase [Saprospiraceae bacterium]|nr:pyruvate:ferredoxin (flavodoxin) oxidoreductase [Saprospiraceae bacterium]
MDKKFRKLILDGNEAVAKVAYKTNEIAAIYPITPSSPMGEHADAYSAKGIKNLWGNVVEVMELQSEAGAAGTVHGSLQGGALTTTFTASQGLLLMIPNMFKIAGELLPAVFHVSARTVATHALSIFGDHSDVMSTRSTGWAMLFGGSVQEAHDMALISQASTLKSKIPFINAFDGFRTSHEINKIDEIDDEIMKQMLSKSSILAFKEHRMTPDRPVIRGTAQNPDVYFQAREASNIYYDKVAGYVKESMGKFKELTGRSYKLFDYFGAPDATRIVILMGSGQGAVQETIEYLNSKNEKVGAIVVRLFRPFSVADFISSIPQSVEKIAVLDRTKEPGAIGEPLYMDVLTAFIESGRKMPKIVGGRYGLSSKEFTPGMVKSVYDELKKENPKNHFTIGIKDDVTFTSLEYDDELTLDVNTINCLFYGLGSDGTVSANKNSIKIIGDTTDNYTQAYFVYDSKKAGGLTTSHLRFGKDPIISTYLIKHADFIAVHQFNFLSKYEIIQKIKKGGTFLLNSPYSKTETWDKLPQSVQEEILKKEVKFYVIDATKVAYQLGLGKRTNTLLQTCFFAISGILPKDEAIQKIKDSIKKSYGHKGEKVLEMNYKAVDTALANLFQVDYPAKVTSNMQLLPPIYGDAPDFVRQVLGEIIAGRGDTLPVSAFPVDGTFPTNTTRFEKRDIADQVPVWDAQLCTQCNKCVSICPHGVIRAKVYDKSLLEDAPVTLKHVAPVGRPFNKDTEAYTLQVSVLDCTGCRLCVEVCPAISKENPDYRAINMVEKMEVSEVEQVNWEFFDKKLPWYDRKELNTTSIKGAMFLEPLFEFSGACAGCGETPYLKLLTQLYGDQLIIANATGCSSIYGGNLPTTPYTVNSKGRGPTWANSLFEDNAEFGLGLRLATNKKTERAYMLLSELKDQIGADLYDKLVSNPQKTDADKELQWQNIEELNQKLKSIDSENARDLLFLSEYLRNKSVWVVGGDGWAYDIGFGGLDHVLASGENINILVLDTEVYSNTGGQKSKSTPIGAAAKFAVAGKKQPKKDLGFIAVSYEHVYVAQIAIGAKDLQTLRAIKEAEEYEGVSLIIAYSHCIEHGYDMADGAAHQELAIETGFWPLYRFDPSQPIGKKFKLDSNPPVKPLEDFMYSEARFSRVLDQDKERGDLLLQYAKDDLITRWSQLESLKAL